MKKITIFALHLGYGGIEKAITSFSNSLSDDYDIEIISTYKLYDKPAFALNNNVSIKYLITDMKPNKKELIDSLKKLHIFELIGETIKAIKILYKRKKLMIKEIKNCKSDIMITTRIFHNNLLSKYGSHKSIKIGWEHNHHQNNKRYINKIKNTSKNLDYFITVSQELKEFYEPLIKPKCIYIPNCLEYYPNILSNLKIKNIISIGRLSKEKGFIDLIDVFNYVVQIYPDWHLNIVGDGQERKKIQDKIEKYGLKDKISLLGYKNKDDIDKLYLESSIYVMPSLIESFGIVVLEASSFGIPTVTFDSAKGVCEIVKDNWDGYIVKNRNKKQMAKRICELISNENRRKIMGDNARKKSLDYSTNKIKEMWINILK